jgi:sporulation related protein
VSRLQPLERECPDCGARSTAGQEYCLECGHRLPPDPVAAGLPRRRLGSGPGLALLATGAVALIAASTVSAVQLADREGESTLIATSPQPEVLPATETGPAGESVPTAAPETTPEPPPVKPAARAPRRLIAWPKESSGWTIVLASVPTGPGNRAVAARQAREAVDQGLRQVGVLTSSAFSSLHPGYLVVFSGVYATRSAAEQALSRARAAGYEAGYTREIVR